MRDWGTVAMSNGESELYAPCAPSADLIFAQAILHEIGLSFFVQARADSSTARAVATKQGANWRMKHLHTRFLFHSRFGVSETADRVRSQDRCEPERHRNKDVNDVVGCEPCWEWAMSWQTLVHLEAGGDASLVEVYNTPTCKSTIC